MATSSEREQSDEPENISDMHSLKEISQQFFEMVPVRRMKWRDEDAAMLVTSPELQQRVLLATVHHPICQKFPPSLTYMRYFMKLLVQKLESEGADICDEMYEAYTNLLTHQEDEDDTLCFKTYRAPCGDRVSLRESVNLVCQGTTGLTTWQAAQNLAEWILENPHVVSNRSVVELGSGLGLTGILTYKHSQPSSFTFSDCHPQVLYLLSRNVERNLVPGHIAQEWPESVVDDNVVDDNMVLRMIQRRMSLEPAKISESFDEDDESLSTPFDVHEDRKREGGGCSKPALLEVNSEMWDIDRTQSFSSLKADKRLGICHLDWECVSGPALDRLRSDVILAADVVYDESTIPALVLVLKRLLEMGPTGNGKPEAYIASTIRNEDTRDAFLVAMGSEGLAYSIVEPPKQNVFHYDRSVPIEILRVSAH